MAEQWKLLLDAERQRVLAGGTVYIRLMLDSDPVCRQAAHSVLTSVCWRRETFLEEHLRYLLQDRSRG